MYREHTESSFAGAMLGGFVLGALAMYLLDPDRGKRRRALVKDKVYSKGNTMRKSLDKQSRDWQNRAKGVAAEIRSATSH